MDETFEGWIAHCFDHPVQQPAWHFDVDAPVWSAPAATTLAYLTRLFTHPSALLEPYSDAQINQGLWYIGFAGNSDFVFALLDRTILLADRVACVASMTHLYDALFAPRCSATLARAPDAKRAENPLNSACYMWWDILPLFPCPGDPDRARLDAAAIAVMRGALGLNSIACQESALHGLGHWALGYPSEVESTISAFLAKPDLHPQLRDYAHEARAGDVL